MKKDLLIGLLIGQLLPQSLDVTFRYVTHPGEEFIRIFVPGTMPPGSNEDWGPNSNGMINPNAPSLMNYDEAIDAYKRTYSLNIGSEYLYKIHFHHNSSGTDYSWISDPLNPLTIDDENNNSILDVTDPLFFQPARHLNEEGLVDGLGVGIFTTGNVDSVCYAVGGDTVSATEFYHDNGVFYVALDPPKTLFESYWIQASIDGELHTVYDQPEIEIVEASLPADVKMGPNWLNGNMILAVYAPSQPVMQVIVTSLGETGLASDAIVMNLDPDQTDVWWTELDLSFGQYEYEYLLINGSRLPDPFTRRLSNGKTRVEIGAGGVSTADDYNWQSNDFIRPSLDTLIIYELHVDDFAAQGSGQGTFDDVIIRLDHLRESGINAIELMPITEFPGGRSWGYNPEIMSSVEGTYGTPENFKQLVDEAHSRNMAVILDLVWNHATSSTPLWKIQPNNVLNPYFKNSNDLNPNETEGTWGMLDFDHFNEKTIEYINEVHRIWLEEYRVDGFRFDATRYVGWDLNQPQFGLLAWADAIDELDSNVYQIAEHLPSDPWLVNNTKLTSSWHDSFHDRLIDHIFSSIGTMTAMQQIIGLYEYSNSGTPYADLTQAVKYMVSHDEQSLIQEMVEFDGVSLSQARAIDKFYASLLFTAQGIPMIWQGQEFGLQTGWTDANNNGDYEEKLQYRPIDWTLLETEVGQSHLTHYSTLAKFRKMNPVFSKGTFFDLYRYTDERVIVYGYKDQSEGNSDDQVVVIANFSSSDQTVNDVPFLSGGNWYNITDPGNDLYTGDGNYSEYSIPAKSAVVYANQEWVLSTKYQEPKVPEKFQILSAYPNPFNGQIQFNISIPDGIIGSISIFDLSGRLIKSFDKSLLSEGSHILIWSGDSQDGKPLSSGVYLVSVKSKFGRTTQKILYLK
ncbi:MAG: T9SS type A sorting domain-containing protein [Candidatus Marinimicrobia bacterium]|jgi:1,4-alpha-glucan branching enzyme|nr:T9SS type A sorting domain-containing protein [Candidatus Neomarinimicrobiota bacterium]MBT3848060.1 T9SS type A sorting domain-containing protein [Candidatus Neomarinimicrobiota bacterium]MBT4054885.1 T9SS type A sorting domain-containing protein [Candidatus Neomarinimicrobiota bacterium]MBT4368937.1 T9SS type A sorting domain-containing protein [Candidatus Neomarinimicrobiota bacterium]MBT4662968.1 T9SS type A sorting domain-containing protein [Candidatus Neomarinimicrobiota bacterium]